MNIADKEMRKDPQKNPENYKDLHVRISGFSVYFTKLEENVQTALIERI